MTPLNAVPSLDAIADDPSKAAGLPADARQRLLARWYLVGGVLVSTQPAAMPPAEPAPAPDWLTPEAVAKRLSFTKAHVLELCRSGDLPSVKEGKYRRIPEDRFTVWLAARRGAGLDAAGSVTLPSSHVSRRGTSRSQTARDVTVAIRHVARRSPGDGQEVGDGGAGHARHDRAADPPARGAAPPGSA